MELAGLDWRRLSHGSIRVGVVVTVAYSRAESSERGRVALPQLLGDLGDLLGREVRGDFPEAEPQTCGYRRFRARAFAGTPLRQKRMPGGAKR
jgi:hypothetical protein